MSIRFERDGAISIYDVHEYLAQLVRKGEIVSGFAEKSGLAAEIEDITGSGSEPSYNSDTSTADDSFNAAEA
jgi:hypothetical protein